MARQGRPGKQQTLKIGDDAEQDSRNNGASRVVQDSSVITPPQEQYSHEGLDTLSKVESAYPPKQHERVEIPPTSPLKIVDDEYHMAHRFRGKAIIFNHYQYEPNLAMNERIGTEIDRNALECTFKEIGFSVNIVDDPTRDEITRKLQEESTNHHFYTADCLVVVVLTHGGEKNTLYAKDNLYNVSDLWSPFMADKCSYLATKPKIFIIQACRGDGRSKKVDVNKDKKLITTDSTKVHTTHVEGEYFSIPAEADILIAFSSFEGNVAHRNEKEGTWYIEALCNELRQNWRKHDLLSMLTRVNRQVAINKECSAVKQMPSIQSTLTRKIFFAKDDESINETGMHDLHKKMDLIITLQEKLCRASSTQQAHYSGDTNSLKDTTFAEWDDLRLSADSSLTRVILTGKEVLLLATGLRMFLQERNLKDEVQSNGSMILILLSLWEQLDTDARVQASDRLISFLNTHASQWPYYALLNIPGVPVRDFDPPRSRRSSRTSTSTQNPSQPPRSRPPFK